MGYLTLEEVAKAIGREWCPAERKRILREIRARERAAHAKILIDISTGGTRPCWRTTSPLLRQHMPEWFDRRDRVAELLTKRLETNDAKWRRQEMLNRHLAMRLRTLEQVVAQVGA
jgi:isoleucyl-tRNA synthetase